MNSIQSSRLISCVLYDRWRQQGFFRSSAHKHDEACHCTNPSGQTGLGLFIPSNEPLHLCGDVWRWSQSIHQFLLIWSRLNSLFHNISQESAICPELLQKNFQATERFYFPVECVLHICIHTVTCNFLCGFSFTPQMMFFSTTAHYNVISISLSLSLSLASSV